MGAQERKGPKQLLEPELLNESWPWSDGCRIKESDSYRSENGT